MSSGLNEPGEIAPENFNSQDLEYDEHAYEQESDDVDHRMSELCRTLVADFEFLVRLPRGEVLHEWVAYNVSQYYKYTSLLFAVLSDVCTPESCPIMSVGPTIEYLWAEDDAEQAYSVPACFYMEQLLTWLKTTIENKDVFPVDPGKTFPRNFMDICSKIFRRLLRFFQHAYFSHFDYMEEQGCVSHINTCLRYVVTFGLHHGLLTVDDIGPLTDLVEFWAREEQDAMDAEALPSFNI